MHLTFVATRKNADPAERELYEMDLLLRTLGLKRAFMDLGLVTVASCTPRDVQIDFVDEYFDELRFQPTDAVALSAKTSCVSQAYAVADEYRSRGVPVILGGIHASLRPDEALEHVDCVVTGEAEHIWPHVVEDLRQGKLKERYDAGEFPPLATVPVPRWDMLDYDKYLYHQVQTTRGCPFTCRFCSVPDISGQSFRFKPSDNVVKELASLPVKGLLGKGRPLYVVDDNFLSRTKYTKDLLRAMVPAYQAGKLPGWSAETTLNVAQDDELLDLFVAAGCNTLIIGLESVSEATLDDMAKGINFCLTYDQAIARIQERGLAVVGNFIVGFDTDTIEVFRDTLDFIQRTKILYPFFSILNPMPGTKLFDDYLAEGRLDHTDWHLYDTRHVVAKPRHMTREELSDGYVWLYEQAYGPKMLERMEHHWKLRTKGSRMAERLLLSARLAPEARRGDRAHRDLFKDVFRLMLRPRLNAQAGQALALLDGWDFARFMDRYKSPDYAANVRRFETGRHDDERLRSLQWDNEKAQRRSARL